MSLPPFDDSSSFLEEHLNSSGNGNSSYISGSSNTSYNFGNTSFNESYNPTSNNMLRGGPNTTQAYQGPGIVQTPWTNTQGQMQQHTPVHAMQDYNSYISQIQILKDTVSKLQNENAVLAAGKMAIESAYSALISRITPGAGSSDSGPDAPLNISVQAVASSNLLSTLPLPQLNRSDYEAIHFWMEKQFKDWKATPEGAAATSPTAYLENNLGHALDKERNEKILTAMHDVWQDLHGSGLLNSSMTWTSIPRTIKLAICNEMARSFEELRFCEDSWKTDDLGKLYYSSWKQTWFTNKANKKMIPLKRKGKVKDEATDDVDSFENAEGSKCLRVETDAEISASSDDNMAIELPCIDGSSPPSIDGAEVHPSTSASGKESGSSNVMDPNESCGKPSVANQCRPLPRIRIKNPLASIPVIQQNGSASIVQPAQAPPVAHEPNNSLMPAVAPTPSSVSQPNNSLTPAVALTPSSVSQPNNSLTPAVVPMPSSVSQPNNSSTPAAAPTPSSVSPAACEPNNSSTPAAAPTPSSVSPAACEPNNLSTPAAASTPSSVSPAACEPNNLSTPAAAPTPSSVPQLTQAPPASGANGSSMSTSVPALSKKRGWRPASNKSARTLCAHRWLKQVSPNGTQDEFNAYFEALSPETKQKYKEEYKQLVERGIWTSGAAEVIAKFSGLPMY